MKNYISTAFSLNMMEIGDFSLIRVKKVSPSHIPHDVKSFIGHPDKARIVSSILGFEIPFNRASLTLKSDDVLYVAQYKGPHLPKGATQLPKGASIDFFEVTTKSSGCKGCSAIECNQCAMLFWTHGA